MEPSAEPYTTDDRQSQDTQSQDRQSQDSMDTDSESGSQESAKARIERLGRQRPSVFKSAWAEVAFVFSIAMSQVLTETFVSGFTVILPVLVKELDVPSASLVWPATAFSLPIAASLLFFGRLGDMYGGYVVYLAGMMWLSLWSVVAGFSNSPLMLIFCRALQGLGAAAFLPTGVMLMGSIYRPGPRKNLVFSIYGASAVLGFFLGIFFAGVVGQYTRWAWYFWIGAILSAITTLSSYLSIPSDSAERRSNGVTMDWLGAALIFCGLSLTVYAITDSAHALQGWKTPHILALLLLGCTLVGAAVYQEGWLAKAPLLPFSIFAVKSMTPLIVALMLNYGVLGVYLVYATQYMQLFMGASPLQVVAWYVPMIVGGLILSTAGGFVLHLIPGRALLAFSGTGWIVALLCFAVAPMGANYWAFTFPSAICATIGIDITFNVVNIFVTTNLPASQQGLAGGLVNSALHLGITFLLGFADIIQVGTEHRVGLFKSYKAVFWFGVAAAALALLLMVIFVKIDKAKSDMTMDEKRELEEAALQEAQAAARRQSRNQT